MEGRPRGEAEWAPRPGVPRSAAESHVPRSADESHVPVSLAQHRRHVARAVGVWGSLALSLEQVRARAEERAGADQEERARAATRALAQEQARDRLETWRAGVEARLGALEARLSALDPRGAPPHEENASGAAGP